MHSAAGLSRDAPAAAASWPRRARTASGARPCQVALIGGHRPTKGTVTVFPTIDFLENLHSLQ